ncbi:hypothetical protein B0T18DRAFT_489666 [Schizothecium vesticola]|uniref:Uncharacterized protein n=1 Tax=Schizothecium vesticola TaxID=314040 RepID=A0AA40ENT2_9PEZI|nr:hypothetical protein B0T18DRAFT_489666 [Schizothecium vesticola]
MPRISNDGSDDDASSEYNSDSGSSVHTIYNAFGDANNFFAPQLSPTGLAFDYGFHGEKRKADDYGDQGHSHAPGAKSRRLTSTRSSTSASESNASSLGRDVLPVGKACTRCAEGLGLFGPTCIVMAGGHMHKKTLNTCANCWYNRMGFCCSVSVGVRKRQSTNQRSTAAHHNGKTQLPVVVAPPSQGSMVHPAYASSSNTASSWEPFPRVAAATPAHAPTGGDNLDFPTTAFGLLNSMGHPPPIPVATAALKSLPPPHQPQVKPSSTPPTTVLLANSLDGKVGSWEKRYENMTMGELVEMQRVLVERLEDTTMRMVAMQKVLAAR